MSKAKGTGRFVVTHTLVDGHAEGTILHGHDDKKEFGTIDYIDRQGNPASYPRRLVHGARKLDTQEQQDRLLKNGAIRELSADELDIVGDDAERLPGKPVPGFAESAPVTIAEKDALIQRLQSENADLRAKHKPLEDAITAGTLSPPQGFKAGGLPEASAAAEAERWKGEAAQKDGEIERLRTALAESQQRAGSQQGQRTAAGAPSDAAALADACSAEELHKLAAKHKVDVPSHATKAEVADALAAKGVKAPK